MHPESARVRATCDYLVPEPLPQPEGSAGGEAPALDPDSPVNNPHAEARREPKPVAELKLLDPACGTMHFGYYAMEVFDAIYRDARDAGRLEIADREIPGAILRHNLFGVDIDRRAVQLAALSLFMKARTMHPEARVTQVNLVAADAALPDSGVRERFLDRYRDAPPVQRAFAQVLEDMDRVAELGSLLRVEERLHDLLTEAGYVLSDAGELRPHRPAHQLGFEEQPGAGSGWTPHYTLEGLREDLRDFARRALEEEDLNAQLFAAEADRAVRLLDVLMERYDVVVMNPPYGEALDWDSIPDIYSLKKNIYCAFLLSARDLLAKNGYVGALTDRTYLLLISYAEFRTAVLHSMPVIVGLDLGWGVLDDANVATIAAIFSNDTNVDQATFIRCLDEERKEEVFQLQLSNTLNDTQAPLVFSVNLSDLDFVPMHTFCYWAPSKILKAFRVHKKFEPTFGIVRKGLSPGNTPRFVREYWEVDSSKIGMHWWAPYANGGAFSPYYRDNHSVVLWHNNGQAIKAITPKSVIRSEDLYGKSGLTYGKRHHLLNVQFLEEDHIFSNEGYIIRTKHQYSEVQLAALLNSCVIRFTVNLISGLHKEVTSLKNLPIPEVGLVRKLPSLQAASTMCQIKQEWDTGNEICTRFTRPWLVQLARPEGEGFAGGLGRVRELLGAEAPEIALPEPVTLEALLDAAAAIEEAADARLQRLQAEIDAVVYDLYEIGPEDRALIERELGERPPELVWPQMEGKSRKEKRREHVRRLLSYFVLAALQADEDGIVPLFEGTGELTVLERLRARLTAEFGEEAAFRLEDDAGKVMGRPVANWLDGQFIKWHTQLYNKRPIIWHVASERYNFGLLLYYHKLDRDTLLKVRNVYLRRARDAAAYTLEQARSAQDEAEVSRQEELLDEYRALDEQLERVITGAVGYRPPAWAEGPYRGGVYDPVIDDGVAVNLTPLQKGEILRYKRMI